MNQLLRYTLVGLMVFSILSKPLSKILNINLDYLDELALLISLMLLCSHLLFKKTIRAVYALVAAFFCYSIIISFLFGLNNDLIEIILQSMITLKFFIITLGFFLLFKDNIILVLKLYKFLIFVLLFGLVLNILFGEGFNNFIGEKTYSRPFSNLIRYGGWVNPNHLGYFMALSIGLILNKAYHLRKILNKKDWILIGFYFLVIILTDSRSSLFCVFLFFIFYYKNIVLRNAKLLLSTLVLFLILIVCVVSFTGIIETLTRNLSDSFSLDSYYIRGIIVNMAIQISYLYFPIGTGAATFGTVLSDGSQVYEDFGVAHRYFFIEKSGIYDSSLAAIMGEYGVFGIVFFGFIIFYFWRLMISRVDISRYLTINALLFVFLFFSLTNPIFTNDIYIFLSFPVFFIFYNSKSLYESIDHF